MTNISLSRDNNRVTVLGGTSSVDGITPVAVYADPTTHRLLVDSTSSGSTVFQYKVFLTVGSGANNDYVTDGTADDVQINAAMLAANVAGGGVVYVQAGTFIIADLLQIPSNVILMGAGINVTTIKAVNAYNPATSVYGTSGRRVMLIGYNSAAISHNQVSDITWDLNVQNIPGLANAPANRIFWIQNYSDFRVTNCRFLNGINWTVFFNLGTQCWFQNNIVLGGYSSTYDQNDGFHIRNSSYWYCQNNYIDTKAGGGTSGDDAIAFVVDSDGTGDMIMGEITGNIIPGSGSRGIIGDFGTTSFNIRDILINDNIISNTVHAGVKLYTQNSTGGIYYGIKIADNDFFNIGTTGSDGGNFIRLDKDYGGVARKMYENISITGNIFRSQNSASNTWYGIDVLGQGNDFNISNNEFDGVVGLGGIKFGEPSNPMIDYVMNGNKINVSDAASNVKGIYLYRASRGTVLGNEIFGHTTGTTYGIYIEATTTDTVYNNVSHNVISTFVNGIAEINSGANPDQNQFFGNVFQSVTTKITKLGTSSTIFGQLNQNFGFNTGSPSAWMHLVAPNQLGGPNSTVGEVFRLDGATMTDSSTAGSGTATGYIANSFGQTTLAATNSSVTTTNASNVYIAGGIAKGTNNTATNSHALYIAAGAVGTQTNSFGLTVNAQTGATNNLAAQFLGGKVEIGAANHNGNGLLQVSLQSPSGRQRVAQFGDGATNTNTTVIGYDFVNNEGWIGAITESVAWRSIQLVPDGGNIKVGGTGLRSTTEGSGQVVIFNGTAPAGTLTNGASFYSASGVPNAMDSSGNVTTFPITGGTLIGRKASGRATAQTGANASVATFTVGSSDASFVVSANANITAFTAGTFNVTVAYTDEGNTARTLTLNFSNLTGTLGIALAAAGPFEGIPVHIRCKASTSITIATSGTFTSLTYNVEGYITQIG